MRISGTAKMDPFAKPVPLDGYIADVFDVREGKTTLNCELFVRAEAMHR